MTTPATSDGPGLPSRVREHPGNGTAPASVTLLLFAAAREAAGCSRSDVTAGTVGEVLAWARAGFGERFSAVLDRSRVWVNGQPAHDSDLLRDGDEVAVLPPVSGG